MTTHPAKSIPHTPGPWATKSTGDYQEIHPVNNKFFTIAKVTGFDSHEAKANARLIAVAPRLLAALIDRNGDLPPVQDGECRVCGRKYFGDDIPEDGMCPSDDCPHTIARAVIAEAKGE